MAKKTKPKKGNKDPLDSKSVIVRLTPDSSDLLRRHCNTTGNSATVAASRMISQWCNIIEDGMKPDDFKLVHRAAIERQKAIIKAGEMVEAARQREKNTIKSMMEALGKE